MKKKPPSRTELIRQRESLKAQLASAKSQVDHLLRELRALQEFVRREQEKPSLEQLQRANDAMSAALNAAHNKIDRIREAAK